MTEETFPARPSRQSNESGYRDKYKPAEKTTENPVLATENEKYNIDSIKLPNKFARDYIGYQDHLNRLSDSTITKYIRQLREVLHFLNNARNTSLLSTTKKDVEVYITHCIDERRNSRRTLSGKLGVIRNLLAHIQAECNPYTSPNVTAIEIKHIDLDEYNDIPPTISRKALTREEVRTLLEHPGGTYPQRNRLIIRILYETGIRNSDLRNLKLEKLDLDGKTITIEDSKGGITYRVPIRTDLVLDLRHWVEKERPAMLGDRKSDYLIPSGRSEKLEMNASLNDIVKNSAERGEIQEKLPGQNENRKRTLYKITPHALRHSITTHLDNAEVDGDLQQLLLGHTDEKSKEVYQHGNSISEQHEKIRTTLHNI